MSKPFPNQQTSGTHSAFVRSGVSCSYNIVAAGLPRKQEAITPVGALERVVDKGVLLHASSCLAGWVCGEPIVREHSVWRPMLLTVLKQRHAHPSYLHKGSHLSSGIHVLP